MAKGHVFIKVEENEDCIKWKCEKCGKGLAFSKVFEPKTDGELPENYEDYVDACEVNSA